MILVNLCGFIPLKLKLMCFLSLLNFNPLLSANLLKRLSLYKPIGVASIANSTLYFSGLALTIVSLARIPINKTVLLSANTDT
jgi:hypothetical protein